MRAYSLTAPMEEDLGTREGTELTFRLGAALATKLVGVLRCRRHYFLAKRGGSVHAVDMFFSHSNLDQAHADALGDRIVQLGSQPDLSPAAIGSGTYVAFKERTGEVADMAAEDLEPTQATQVAFTDLLRFVGNGDASTKRLLQSILGADRIRGLQLSTLIKSLRKG